MRPLEEQQILQYIQMDIIQEATRNKEASYIYTHTHKRRTLSIVLAPVSATSVAKRLLPDLNVSRKVVWLLISPVGLQQLLINLLVVFGTCWVVLLSLWLLGCCCVCTIDESGKRKPNTERKEGEDIENLDLLMCRIVLQVTKELSIRGRWWIPLPQQCSQNAHGRKKSTSRSPHRNVAIDINLAETHVQYEDLAL